MKSEIKKLILSLIRENTILIKDDILSTEAKIKKAELIKLLSETYKNLGSEMKNND